MLFNCLADLQALVFVHIHFADGIAQTDYITLAGEVDILISFFETDVIDDIAIIKWDWPLEASRRSLPCLTVTALRFTLPSLLNVQLNLGRDRGLAIRN